MLIPFSPSIFTTCWSDNGTATGTTSWTVNGVALQTGANVITATAHDAAGNTGQAVLTVTYNPPDTMPPTISITSPTSASTLNSINLGGTASGTVNWSITGIALQSGTNLITVTAYDAAGNSGNAGLTVTYNLPALGIVNQNSSIVLTWPTNAVGFILENATNLPAANWTTNSSSSFIVNGQYAVTNAVSNAQHFTD